MSGQFQQRRLARPAFQLDVLDAFAGDGDSRGELRTAWRELSAARRRHEELLEGAARAAERVEELRALVEATDGLEPGTEADCARSASGCFALEDLVTGTAAAAEALAPEDGDGAAALAARAERAVAPLESLAPELARAGDELRDVELRLRETASELRSFLATLGAEPGRLEEIEASCSTSPTREGASTPRTTKSCSRARPRRAPSSPRSTRASIRPTVAARRSPRPRRASASWRNAARAARGGRAALRRSGRRRARGPRPRRRRVRGAPDGAGARPDGRRRGRVPDPPEPRSSARTCRADSVGRRALAHRARDRGRRGR